VTQKWAAPTFIIPKKNGTVRFISDFRKLNEMLKRMPYPIPKIAQMLQELEKFANATSLDLNMGYFTIKLDYDAKKNCTIVTPFGKYQYLRLPMGKSCSPDIFQEEMSDLMQHLNILEHTLMNLWLSHVLIPQVRPARTYSISPWEMNHLPREIEQQAYHIICIERLCVTSHSQPLINAQHLMASTKLLVNNNK
jgi:hypothetical protein